MSDWPSFPAARGVPEAISTTSDMSVGPLLRTITAGTAVLAASTAWPAANRALFVPFRLTRMWVARLAIVGCGATGGGNFDAGIYDQWGNLIVASGATGRSASADVAAELTDTTLGPGVYYMGLAVDGTNNMVAWAPSTAGACKALGLKEAASSYTLPATVTYATVSSAYVPSLAIYGTSL